jgi:hypothetical protein
MFESIETELRNSLRRHGQSSDKESSSLICFQRDESTVEDRKQGESVDENENYESGVATFTTKFVRTLVIREVGVRGEEERIGCDACPIPHDHPEDGKRGKHPAPGLIGFGRSDVGDGDETGDGEGERRTEEGDGLSLDAAPYDPEADVAAYVEIREPDEQMAGRLRSRRIEEGRRQRENTEGAESGAGPSAGEEGKKKEEGGGGAKRGEKRVADEERPSLVEFHAERKRRRGYAAMSTGGAVGGTVGEAVGGGETAVGGRKRNVKQKRVLLLSSDEDEVEEIVAKPKAKKAKKKAVKA